MTNEEWKSLSPGDILYTTWHSNNPQQHTQKVFLRLKKYERKWGTWVGIIISEYEDLETKRCTGDTWDIGRKDKYSILVSKKRIGRLNIIGD